MPVMPFEGLCEDDEVATFGEPVDMGTGDEPSDSDVTWLLRETDPSTIQADEENRADWALHHAEFWNGSL